MSVVYSETGEEGRTRRTYVESIRGSFCCGGILGLLIHSNYFRTQTNSIDVVYANCFFCNVRRKLWPSKSFKMNYLNNKKKKYIVVAKETQEDELDVYSLDKMTLIVGLTMLLACRSSLGSSETSMIKKVDETVEERKRKRWS